MHVEFLPEEFLVPHSAYVRELRPELPADVFEPATSRLALVPAHLAIISIATVAISSGRVPWPISALLSLVIGVSFASLAFVGHEAVHGGIVRRRTVRHVVGWIAFLPFTLSPRLWAAWHDRTHHANANTADDPDAYPTLAEYRASPRIRRMTDAFALGHRRWRGALSLLVGFTVQSTHQLIAARRLGYLKPPAFAFAIAETLAAATVWVVVAAVVDLVPFLFAFVIPLLVANVIVMSFVLTNHSLSPRVEIDDPLVNGLSVTAPRWVEWLTLHFGYHVEHHLFPAMSSRYARRIRALVRERWPGRYQSMPLAKALRLLYRTGRVYKDAVTLVDPRTGHEYAIPSGVHAMPG